MVHKKVGIVQSVDAAVFFIDKNGAVAQPFKDQFHVVKVVDGRFDLFTLSQPPVIRSFGFVGQHELTAVVTQAQNLMSFC